MTTKAFVGNVFLHREKGGSPGEYERVCQVFGISGLGQTNDLIEATTFCSGGNREWINGLADGSEITLECNYETGTTGAILGIMIADVQAKNQRKFIVSVDDGSPSQRFSFTAICLSWTLNPAVDDRNTISFGLKVSGAITLS